MEKKARLYWNGEKWVLELFKDEGWCIYKMWRVLEIDKEKAYGYDAVNDNILCEIEYLQYLGYDVRVCNHGPKDYD